MVEDLILSNLLYNEGYGRKVIPFLHERYFATKYDRVIFNCIKSHVAEYNRFPDKTVLGVAVDSLTNLNQDEVSNIHSRLQGLRSDQADEQWLIDQTEKFCKDKAIYNAISDSILILDDKTGKQNVGSIPSLLEEALSVSFDTNIGHDFFEDVNTRYDFYHKQESRIPFDLDYLNKITKGGLPRKTLNVILAGTGVGKSLFMCHCTASNLAAGKNVLYITMEMAEERIAERIDANLTNTTLDELAFVPRDVYIKKIERVKEKTVGKLIIKEYPTL
jgi:replicative DNA helicase